MDFHFTPNQLAWRNEVRGWFAEHVPTWLQGSEEILDDDERYPAVRAFFRKLAEKGWLTMAWPQEYGGAGAGIIEQMIFNEEYGYARAPMVGAGPSFVGPSIMIAGNADQKQRFLPAIARAEVAWCQGFSEPDTGSDLASLKTRAVEDGDNFIVNGTKIWTSQAHRADWCFLAVRTDPEAAKHKGISVLLVDMKSPGIAIRPIVDMAGVHSLNQVFFDNLVVPRVNLLGEQNRGWYTMMATLGYERSMVGLSAGARRVLEILIEYVREAKTADGRPMSTDPSLASTMAQLAIEIEVARLLAYRTASVQQHGQVPDTESSMSKMYSSELQQRVYQFGMEILANVAASDTRWQSMKQSLTTGYLQSYRATIAGGTSEIQRGVVAMRGLGMPR